MQYIDEKSVVLLVEVEVKSEFLEEAVLLAKAQLVPTLEEAGCIALFQTAKENEPTKWIFFEAFSSEEAYRLHMAQSYTKSFFASLEGKIAGPPKITHLGTLGVRS